MTWKRYLYPYSDSDSYHGMVYLPNGPQGKDTVLFWIEKLKGAYTIPDGSPNSVLRLGYQDDQYDDNGYDRHDDGTDGQCVGLGPVVVMVEVEHPH